MKKTLIIIGSIVLVVILLGLAWWYLLMNGRPESLTDIPNPFGSGGTDAFPAPPVGNVEKPPAGNGSLRKISEDPVAGAVAISRDGATYIRFVLRGTGHIFEANAATGVLERLTGTTIPRVTKAVWSPQGSRVALLTETGTGETRTFVGTIERTDDGEGTLTTAELPSAARNIAFSATGESVYYTVPSTEGSTGYEHNLKTRGSTVRFTSPLRDIVAVWGSEANASLPIIVYTAPTAHLRGYAYEGAGQKRIAGDLRGLTVIPVGSHRVISYADDNSFVSRTDTLSDISPGISLGVPAFPEKCAADPLQSTILWCGAPLMLAPGAYPDLWYEGSVSFDDSVWKLDVETGGATLVNTPSEEAGELIDVTDLAVSDIGDILIFINKRDGTLWSQTIR